MRYRQPPGFIAPMLLASGVDLPPGDDWWAELKLDGARGQLRVVDRVPELRTRRGRRCDTEFPEILAAATGLPDVVLDGEIVVPGADGHPDFAALRARLGAGSARARVAAAVRDERAALVTLAANGVAVAAGSRYHSGAHQPHIRAATGRLTADPDAVADVIALAVSEGDALD